MSTPTDNVWLPTLVRFLDTAGNLRVACEPPRYEVVAAGDPVLQRRREAVSSRWMVGDVQTSSTLAAVELPLVIRAYGNTHGEVEAWVGALRAAAGLQGGVEVTVGTVRTTWRADAWTTLELSNDPAERAQFQRTMTLTLPVQPLPIITDV